MARDKAEAGLRDVLASPYWPPSPERDEGPRQGINTVTRPSAQAIFMFD
jgi:hypothetical protein